jgi:hypothetical protein
MSCSEKNSLQREGTSQLNRVLAALSPKSAPIDGRDTADLILFANRYARCLNYFPSASTPNDTWEPLMKMDISVTLATLSKLDPFTISNYKKLVYKKIAMASDSEATLPFKFLFDLIFTIVRLIDTQYRLLPDDQEIKKHIHQGIDKMAQSLVNLDHLFGQFKTTGWLDLSVSDLDGDAPLPVESCGSFEMTALSEAWLNVTPVDGLTLPSFATLKENITHIIRHNFFNAQVESILQGVADTAARSRTSFEKTLDDFPRHTPHYALFLSFVRIFMHAQEHLNLFTKRHLDFYYKEVLQLKNKAPEPDAAHLLFELQKPVDQHLLAKGTLFKGGRDSNDKELTYVLTEEIVLNKAKVGSLHSQQYIVADGLLLASPVAASEDGLGADITAVDRSWLTFGDPGKSNKAGVGFAIASSLLYLKEGQRTIKVTVHYKKSGLIQFDGITKMPSGSWFKRSKVLPVSHCFSAKLTGEKDWVEVKNVSLYLEENYAGQQLVFQFKLDHEQPAIIPFSQKIHKENFKVGLPIVKFIFKQGREDGLSYSFLSRPFQSIDVSVEVNGVKNLILSNDAGTIDASRPFKPFGDFPPNQASFYIGSKEIFQKKLTGLDLNLNWDGEAPALFPANYLHQSHWHGSLPINANSISFSSSAIAKSPRNFENNESLKATTQSGFLRLRLQDSEFSMAKHLKRISEALSAMTMTDNGGEFTFVVQPTPVPKEIILNNFSIDYRAEESIPFNDTGELPDDHIFFQLTPFGFRQSHPLFIDNAVNAVAGAAPSLLTPIHFNGEFIIELEQTRPREVITILFQVADGSSNPLKEMEVLEWFYLSEHNNWRKFESRFVIDQTRNLTCSGIVTLTLPKDASNDTTLFESGSHWIKIGARQNCDAVCKLILVQAQAGLVSLVQDELAGIEFRSILPTGSISKLVVGDNLVKSITQPFDSFAGRPIERDNHYYTRVSERLRHKQRASTIWDFEHIVLEKFPGIFKVRCLNHSGFYKVDKDDKFCENYPGHVTIIPIPDLNNKTGRDLLRPYTPIGLLKDIEEYIRKLCSPFVQLHVKNPVFEEIQVEFEVKFFDNLDEGFYSQLLNKEIEKFLSPWAFDPTTEISFGGELRKSAILNFVEERSYVDYVTCFKMHQVIERVGTTIINKLSDIEVAKGSTACSILISYFDKETNQRHIIKSPATCDC